MATYTTQRTQKFGVVYGTGQSRQLVTDTVTVSLTTAMIDNTNDEVELLYVPAGAVFDSAVISATDMDTNGTPTLAFDVGDDSDEDRIFAASTVGQAGTMSAAWARTAHGYKCAVCKRAWNKGTAGRKRVSGGGWRCPECVAISKPETTTERGAGASLK